MTDFDSAKVHTFSQLKKKKSRIICRIKKMLYLCNRKSRASVAEQVDALDSKSSGIKPVPVRFRPDVQRKGAIED